MWLIETESLKLEFFVGNDIPEYAILSHTWGVGEVTFQDWQDLREASKKPGFAKIHSACAQARDDDLDYIWVDTNCIDKSSSAELSEAINSMFAWYRDSRICYVYLADVEDPDDVAGKLGDETKDFEWDQHFERQNPVEDIKKARFTDSLRKSRWFTRGWTLQELLAPTCIRFLTNDWKPIIMNWPERTKYNINPMDSKALQGSLLELLSDITGIRLDALTSPQYIMYCSNGEKMSWMAGRKTTRDEDVAYCLLGIFDINMPLLYGEGSKAFKRLQEEITTQSTDHSLFAWQWPQDSGSMAGRRYPNLFAESTKLFSNLNTKLLGYDDKFNEKVYVDEDEGEDEVENNNPLSTILSLTNFGLSINLELIPTADPNYIFGALINVIGAFRSLAVLPDRELWCIPLQKMGQVYHRAPFPPGPFPVRTRRKQSVHPIHIPRDQVYFPTRHHYRYQYAFVILFPDLDIGAGFRIRSLGEIGGAVLSPHRSTVSIPRDVLQNRKIAASVLSIERSATCSFVLYVGTREVNNEVETAVKLFPTGTSLETVENIQMTFRPPSFYWDECRSFSLVVSKGHRVDPLPGESGPSTIFSVSLYVDQDAAEPGSEGIAKSDSEEASESESEETANSESDVEMS
jgi:hypothetical protein